MVNKSLSFEEKIRLLEDEGDLKLALDAQKKLKSTKTLEQVIKELGLD